MRVENFNSDMAVLSHATATARSKPASGPKGPVDYQTYIRRAHGTALGTHLASATAAAVTLAVVSNPVGWGVGAGALGLAAIFSPFHLWKLARGQPRLTVAPAVATAQLVAWFEARGMVVDDRVPRAIRFVDIEDRDRLRAERPFRWMTADTLNRLVQALNACHARSGDGALSPSAARAIERVIENLRQDMRPSARQNLGQNRP